MALPGVSPFGHTLLPARPHSISRVKSGADAQIGLGFRSSISTPTPPPTPPRPFNYSSMNALLVSTGTPAPVPSAASIHAGPPIATALPRRSFDALPLSDCAADARAMATDENVPPLAD